MNEKIISAKVNYVKVKSYCNEEQEESELNRKNNLKIDNRLIIRIDDVKLLFDFVLYTFLNAFFCSYKNELCVDNIWFLLKSLIEKNSSQFSMLTSFVFPN